MNEELPRSLDNEFIRLTDFGVLSAIIPAKKGCEAVLHLGASDVYRLVAELLKVEENSLSPDARLMDALRTVISIISPFSNPEGFRNYDVEARIPLGFCGFKLAPINDPEDPLFQERFGDV